MDLNNIFSELMKGFTNFSLGNAVMIVVGVILIYLAVAKDYEPNLLVPIGIGCILANVGMAVNMTNGVVTCNSEQNFLTILYCAGISTELFPLLIFVGVGAMIDFTPLLAMPQMVVLGAAGQFGIYATLILAVLLGFDLNEAASIGVIGAIDGPTAIFVTSKLAPALLGPIAVAAYTYMSLIPVIQPPIMRLLTTKKERMIRMDYSPRPVTKRALIIFPIVVTVVISLLAPQAAPLIATLMLGNFLRECGVVDRLKRSTENELINMSTLFLGLTIGATMTATAFLNFGTLQIMVLGLVAFVIDTVAGLGFGKLMALVSGGKINPLIGACGISAFPMAARLSAKAALDEDYENFILMHAMGSNTAGQLGSVIAGGLLLVLVASILKIPI
jgi:sodium ion-translocating decarboxylase beta subunit